MNFLPEKKYGLPSWNFVKKNVLLPDLTVMFWFYVCNFMYSIPKFVCNITEHYFTYRSYYLRQVARSWTRTFRPLGWWQVNAWNLIRMQEKPELLLQSYLNRWEIGDNDGPSSRAPPEPVFSDRPSMWMHYNTLWRIAFLS